MAKLNLDKLEFDLKREKEGWEEWEERNRKIDQEVEKAVKFYRPTGRIMVGFSSIPQEVWDRIFGKKNQESNNENQGFNNE